MGGFGMDFFQTQQMSQQLHLSTQMLQSLRFLMMSHYELTENISLALEENPALSLVRPPTVEVKNCSVPGSRGTQTLKTMTGTEAGQRKSDDFQNFLENQEDEGHSIQQHLWEQFRLTTSCQDKLSLAEKIIFSLDDRGFNQVHPLSLLDSRNPAETHQLLEDCLDTLQTLDPVGCCTSGAEESLYIQALERIEGQDAVPVGRDSLSLSLFFLAGNLQLLERPRAPSILKKLKELLELQENTNSTPKAPAQPSPTTATWTRQPRPHHIPKRITEAMVENAIRFIQTLDPLPARQFISRPVHYIYPEVAVRRIDSDDGPELEIQTNSSLIPVVRVSPLYQKLQEHSDGLSRQEKKMVRSSVKNAQEVIQALQFRESTIQKAALAIAELQRDFFLKGPRHLRPLRMKDVAERIGVNESTISRMANGKYLRCQWGVFEIKYFFSSQVETEGAPAGQPGLPESGQVQEGLSKEGSKVILKELLEEHQRQAPGSKPLSDQKLSDLLAQRGIRLARRTVAKYRSELNIESSFDRK